MIKFRLFLIIWLFAFGTKLSAQFVSNAFLSKVDFATTTTGNPQGVAAGDLNGDGKSELVVANLASNEISIYLNQGSVNSINTTTLASPFSLTTYGTANPSTLTIADLDGDGKQEILVGYGSASNNNISVFKNNFNGTVFNATSFSRSEFISGASSTSAPNSISAEDFDQDGKKDLIVTNYGSSSISVLRNTCSSGVISFASPVNFSAGSNPAYSVVEDFNADGKRDIAVSNWASNSITVYQNTSSIGSISATLVGSTVSLLTTGTNPHYIKFADFDQDGKTDLICANYTSNTVSIFRNTSSGTISFAAKVDISVGTSSNPQGLVTGDFDYDGKPDFAVALISTSLIKAFKNQYTSGSFTSSSFSSATNFTPNTSPVAGTYVDMDKDLRPEIIFTNYTAKNVSIYKNNNLSPEPSISGGSLNISQVTNGVQLNFPKGNGSGRIVVCRQGTGTIIAPVDSHWYNANSVFGSGENLGSGNFVVYSDTGSSVTVTNLLSGTTYYFTVYEYNGIGGFSNYLNSVSVAQSITTATVYYSKSTGALNQVSTWGVNSDGSGASPSAFNGDFTYYIIANNPTPSISSNWIVTGSGSAVLVGDGLSSTGFSIPAGNTLFVDSIAVKRQATLTFLGNLVANKVYFDSLSNAQFISTSAQNIPGYSYFNLFLLNSQKTLLANCEVRNQLNLFTQINTGSNILTLGVSPLSPGSLSRNASGNINGKFKRYFAPSVNSGLSGLFPIVSGVNSRSASIEFTSAPSAGGSISIEYVPVSPGNSGLQFLYDFTSSAFVEVNKASINGYWKVEASGITGGNYSITLTGAGIYGVNSYPDLRVIRRTNSSSVWTLPSGSSAIIGTGSNSSPVVGRSGLTSFGEFTIGGDSTVNPLPVKYIGFSGSRIDNSNLLKWSTAIEINSSGFEVQRNIGFGYEKIGFVKSKQRNGINEYRFEDFDLVSTSCYYRLKQIDLDGSFDYSKEISIQVPGSETIEVYPNPASEYLMLNVGSSLRDVFLLSSDGRKIWLEDNGGKFSLNSVESGVYVLIVNSVERTYCAKVIVSKNK